MSRLAKVLQNLIIIAVMLTSIPAIAQNENFNKCNSECNSQYDVLLHEANKSRDEDVYYTTSADKQKCLDRCVTANCRSVPVAGRVCL